MGYQKIMATIVIVAVFIVLVTNIIKRRNKRKNAQVIIVPEDGSISEHTKLLNEIEYLKSLPTGANRELIRIKIEQLKAIDALSVQ